MKNLIIRTISGISLGLLLILGILYNKFLFATIIVIIMSLMMYEFYKLTSKGVFLISKICSVITAISLFLVVFAIRTYSLDYNYLILCLLPLILGILIDTIHSKSNVEKFAKLTYVYTSLLYIALPWILLNFLVIDINGHYSAKYFIAFLILIWSSDIGAYCFGMLFGKNGRKLCPKITPKKSWAGFFGGLVSVEIAAVILHRLGSYLPLGNKDLNFSIGLAIIIHIFGVYGDLLESRWKRHFDTKDSGNIIPGHGGILDRFDSSLIAIPMALAYIYIVNLF